MVNPLLKATPAAPKICSIELTLLTLVNVIKVCGKFHFRPPAFILSTYEKQPPNFLHYFNHLFFCFLYFILMGTALSPGQF